MTLWKALPPGVVKVNPAFFGPSFATRAAAAEKCRELNEAHPLAKYRPVKVRVRGGSA